MEREALIELVVSAFRERDPWGGVGPSPAFFDLSEDERRQAFDEALAQRAVEAALDPEGLTSTARAVLARIRGA